MKDDDDIKELPERESTRPPVEHVEKGRVRQFPFRIHGHQYELLKIILKRDALSMQKFLNYCANAYLDADPSMLKVLRQYRLMDAMPKEARERHVISLRERWSIFDEIENEEKDKKG